jgi:hypothetical protein
MTTFALIAEGITDQVVLDAILNGHYRGQLDDEVDTNSLQPLRDATDGSRVAEEEFGGWELVLEYCADHERLVEALEFNDYLVIQIDTDCGEHPNFGVPLTVGGKDRPVHELVEETQKVIIAALGADFYQEYQDRILFAICVHSLECWLFSLHESDNNKKNRSKSCEKHLGVVARKNGILYQKDYPIYDDLSREYRKKGVIARHKRAMTASKSSFQVCRLLWRRKPTTRAFPIR